MKKEVKFLISMKELDGIIRAFEFWISGKAEYDWAIPVWDKKYVKIAIDFLKTYLSKEDMETTLVFSKRDTWDYFTGALYDITSHCDNLPKEYWFIKDIIYDRLHIMEEKNELPEGWQA